MGGLLSPASDTKKGLLTNNLFKTLNCLSLSWGVSGGGVKTWHKIAKYYLATYNPIQISMFYGYYNGEKTKYDISLTWSNDIHGITGSANNLLGYVQDGDTVTLYVVSTALQSVSAIIIGGSIVSSEQSDQTEEPSGIVYIP